MKVDTVYRGRLGNNLFQYAFSRIIAEDLGYSLNPYKGEFESAFVNCKEPLVSTKTESNNQHEFLTDGNFDFESVLNNKTTRTILCDGYFQKHSFYDNYRCKIKKWFELAPLSDFTVSEKDIILHIRRSDFILSDSVLPFNWYDKILQDGSWGKIYITGGCNQMNTQMDIDSSVISHFAQYNPIYINSDSLTTFKIIQEFTNIVQSQSTFCWWAAYLSERAEKIFTPIPSRGNWCGKNPDIDLIINHCSRYINLKQNIDF